MLLFLLAGLCYNGNSQNFNTTYLILNDGSTKYFDLQASTGNPDFNGANLGTFTVGTSGLQYNGAEHNITKCGSCDFTASKLYYRIFKTGVTPGAFISNTIGFASDVSNSCGGRDQKWAVTTTTTNLLAGLAPGNYSMEVYSDGTTTCAGTIYANNGGSNYKATFTVAAAVGLPVFVQATAPVSTGSYATVSAAFAAINAGTHKGAITVTVGGNTSEPVATGAVLYQSGYSGTSSYTSVNVVSDFVANRLVSANMNAGVPLIDLNGADNVTIGLYNATYSFQFANTNGSSTTAGTSTIRFINGATNNRVRFCSLVGYFYGTETTAGGTVLFSTDASGSGNDNNIIEGNYITCATGSVYATKAICSIGTATTGKENSGNTIGPYNYISNYFDASKASSGIYLAGGTTDWTINDNSFYQTGTVTQTSGAKHSAISIENTSGNNFSIINNIIGSTSPTGATGTYTFVGVSGSEFTPVYLNVGTSTATSVQNNVIKSISISGNLSGEVTSTLSTAPFKGIYVAGGLVNIGNITGNTIGSQSATGSITYTSSSTSKSEIYGILNYGSSNWITNNNLIGGITAANSGTAASSIFGISCYTTSSATWTCTGNIIGGTAANSIQSTAIGTTASVTGTVVRGILNVLSASTVISGNTIRNLSSSAIIEGVKTSAAIIGICDSSATSSHIISQNVIYNLSAKATTANSVSCVGVVLGASSAGVFSRNKIYGITNLAAGNPGTSVYPFAMGINVSTSGSWTVSNNMITIDNGGSANTNSMQCAGVFEEGVGTRNYYFNSFYIGGNSPGLSNSVAFQRYNAATLVLRNNIFDMQRTGGGSNYAIANTNSTPATNWGASASNNNILNCINAAKVGVWGSPGAGDRTLAAWRTISGGDANSYTGETITYTGITSGDLRLNMGTTPTAIESGGAAAGSVIDDWEATGVRTGYPLTGQLNGGGTAPDIGADENDLAPKTDVGAILLVAPTAKTCYSNAEAVTIRIQNYSLNTLYFTKTPVVVTTNVTGAVTATLSQTINIGTLAPGATLDVVMSAMLDMTTIGNYTFNAVTSLTGDANTSNNSLSPAVVRTTSATTAGTATSSVSSYCTTSGKPTLTLTGTSGTIQWQESTTSASAGFVNVTGAITATYTPAANITTTTWYKAVVSCGASSAESNVITVAYNAPTISGTTPGSKCGPGPVSVNIGAAGTGGILNWYAAVSGGSSLGTGTSFATPTISTTTDYYVASEITGTTSGTKAIGAGATSSSTVAVTPFYSLYGGAKTQFIYTASELTTLGLKPGNLTALSINVSSLGRTTLAGFTISIGNTAQTAAVTNTAIVAGLTTVYSNASQALISGSNKFLFSTPFNWNGTSNIVVSFCFSNNDGGGSSSSIVSDAAGFTSSLAIYADNVLASCLFSAVASSDACISSTRNATSSNRPQIIFNGEIGYTCISARTKVTATINETPTAVSISPTSVTALCAGSVQMLVASGGNVGGLPILSQNFNSGLGTWTVSNGTGHTSGTEWLVKTPPYTYSTSIVGWAGFDGSNFAIANSDIAGSSSNLTFTRLTSPVFSTVGKTAVNISFKHFMRQLSETNASVEYSLDGATWVLVTGGTYTSVGTTGAGNNPPTITSASLALNAAALNKPSVQIRFRYDASWDWYWGIDDINITGTGPVPITWSAVNDLYTDIAATASYDPIASPDLPTIYAKATSNVTYTATATNPANTACKTTQTVVITVTPKGQWVGPTGADNDWNTASNWCGGIPDASTDVIIPAGKIVKIDAGAASALAKTIKINGTLNMIGALNLTISSGGTFTNSGTFDATASTTGAVIFAGTGTGTVSGTTTFKNVQIAGGVDFGLASTIGANGTLTINAGGSVNTNAPVYDCTSTLVYNFGGAPGIAYGRNAEWGTVTSGAGFPGNVRITNNTRVNYANGSTAARSICGNLIIDNGSELYMSYDGVNPTAALTVGGNVVLDGNLGLSTASGGDLNIKGNWTRGSSGNLYPNSRAIIFNGTTTQTITRTGSGNEDQFAYMLVDKASGSVVLNTAPNATNVTLNANTGDVLQLLNGNLNLNGQSLSMNNGGGNIKVAGGVRTITGGTGSMLYINGSKTVVADAPGTLVTDVDVQVIANAAINFGGNLSTVNGVLQLNAGSYVDINAPFYGNSSLLKYNAGSIYDRRVEWDGAVAGGVGYPNDVLVTNNTILQPGGPGIPGTFRSIAFNAKRHVTIDAGSAIYMDATDKVMTVPMKVGGNLTIAGSLSASSVSPGDVYVSGNWNRTGTFTHNNRAVFFDGAVNSSLTATGGQEFAYVFLDKTTATPQLQLLDNMSVTRQLGLTKGVLNLAAKDVIMKSDINYTGQVSEINASADITYGTGRFVIERYIRYSNNWNLIASPTDEAQTIYQSWQEGGLFFPAIANGKGTQVTGPTYTAGTPNGLDAWSVGHSMKSWNAANQQYDMVTHTDAAGPLVNKATGFYLYARGDRSVAPGFTGSATTLSSRGKIMIGRSGAPLVNSSTVTGADKSVSIANPFASAVDFRELTKNSNVKDHFIVWDPTPYGGYGVGAFQTFANTAAWMPTPSPAVASPYNGVVNYWQIQSGQAFFVESIAAGAVSVGFEEDDKELSNRTTVNRGASNPADLVMLSTMLHSTATTVADGNRVVFDAAYSNAVAEEDASKVVNSGEVFAVAKTNHRLIVEGRAPLAATDTIFYSMGNLRTQNYTLSFEPRNLAGTTLTAELIDAYLHSRTTISLSDSSYYSFAATADAASKAANRFMLVFKQQAVLPVSFVSIAASRQADRSIAVNWKVSNEVNIVRYEVERSANGSSFAGILQAAATNSNAYTKTDIAPLAADNFYRIKAIGVGGELTYSPIVKVAPVVEAALIAVTPNPVKGKQINIRFAQQPAGAYAVRLTNAAGQTVYQGSVTIAARAEVKIIALNKLMPIGSYQLSIRNKAGEVLHAENILIE